MNYIHWFQLNLAFYHVFDYHPLVLLNILLLPNPDTTITAGKIVDLSP